MTQLHLREDLARAWRDRDAFEAARLQGGAVAKCKDGRRTLRFELEGRGFYLKYHAGAGWPEILKNLLQLRLPVLDAGAEYRAALRLAAAGVPSLEPAGFGATGWNPARRRSFLVSEEIAAAVSLEDFCAPWRVAAPPARVRRLLIERVATLVAAMHAAGVNHRDLYLCHFLLEPRTLAGARSARQIGLHLIDLHRAQLRTRVPRRWRAKDLGGLLFSAAGCGLTRRDILRFLRVYSGHRLRGFLSGERRLLAAAGRRAARMRRKAARAAAVAPT